MSVHTFHLTVVIHDPAELWDAAMAQLGADGIDADQAAELIGPREDPNIDACLVMVLDQPVPGGDIEHSGCERDDDDDDA